MAAGRGMPELETLIAGPEVAKVGLGFAAAPPAPLFVSRVAEGSWGAKCGFRGGEQILAVNGRLVSQDDFTKAMQGRPIELFVDWTEAEPGVAEIETLIVDESVQKTPWQIKKAGRAPSPCRVMAAAAAAVKDDPEVKAVKTPPTEEYEFADSPNSAGGEGSPKLFCVGESSQVKMVKHALSKAQRESSRLQRRVRYPALIIGFLLMGGSMWWVATSWTSSSSLFLFDLLRSLGCISWLCACLPSDRWGPKLGSFLLIVLGVKCLIWHTENAAEYAHQLTSHAESGKPCRIENEETNCILGAYTIGSISLMYIVMHVWQLPYLAYGICLPSRATIGRLWVGLALLHLTKGATDFIVP
eukprot:s3990_g1.t1